MLHKLTRALLRPWRVIAYIEFLLNRKKITRIGKEGKIYYEYKGDLYPEYLSAGNAMSFIKKEASRYCKGKGIDVGADIWPFPGAIPVRNEKHQNAYKLDNFENGSLDYVISSHCLEHLEKWQDALKLWISKLRINGIIFLYLPHKSNKLWHPNAPWGGPGHKWIPTYEVLNSFLSNRGVDIIEYNPDKDEYWSFFIVGRKIKK